MEAPTTAPVDRARRIEDYPAPAARPAGRTPIPMHRDDEPEEELENLLRPRQHVQPRPPAVIDDFDNEPLDDDPLLGHRDRDEER
jgi:hypothetical protein